ncbi:MAG: hypothetical protein COA95_01755 [Methylophaga sp.]|nr:MAG: hypothetical protein COA95_01755 [Methylophaga sp.]
MKTRRFQSTLAAALLFSSTLLASTQVVAVTINTIEDVMTSTFFYPPGTSNAVQGYDGDGKTTFRVSTNEPFGTSGAETIYLSFDSSDFAGFSAGSSAILTMQSAKGGFGGDADAANPFTVSAHAVTADPISSIMDDTNAAGTMSWLDFYGNEIATADAAASTVIDSFGAVTFDVSAIVNDWITGANTFFTIALTGLNDISGNDFLHGFLNNSETPGSSYLDVTNVSAVPIPAAIWLFGSALMGLVGARRKAV